MVQALNNVEVDAGLHIPNLLFYKCMSFTFGVCCHDDRHRSITERSGACFGDAADPEHVRGSSGHILHHIAAVCHLL